MRRTTTFTKDELVYFLLQGVSPSELEFLYGIFFDEMDYYSLEDIEEIKESLRCEMIVRLEAGLLGYGASRRATQAVAPLPYKCP
ncbi:hypothetical protein [Nibribacter koreensis]